MAEWDWYNEESDFTLKTRYFLDGENVQQAVRRIAKSAAKYAEDPSLENRVYEAVAKGWIVLPSPIWANMGTDRGLPISCVIGDTWINTEIGGGKQAKDIIIGDKVLTHKNRFKKITDIIKTEKRSDIYRLKVCNRMTDLYITGNHLVLTNLGWVRVDGLNPDTHLVAINGDLDYVSKKHFIDMEKYIDYDFINIDNKLYKELSSTKIKKRLNRDYSKNISAITKIIDIDDSLAWAVGLWFAEGSLSVDKNKNPNGIRITTNNNDEIELTDKWRKIICDKFNVNGKTYKNKLNRNGKECSWLTTNINSQAIGNLFKTFGNNCKDKTAPEWIMNLPKKQLQCFLDGLLDGDGTKTASSGNRITLANPKLILQIYNIGLKLGHDMSVQMQQKSGKLSTTRYVYTITFRNYKLSISKNNGGAAIKFHDGLRYAPIRTLEKTEKIEDVYDFTVEEDHSFSAAGVILHNCFNSHISDSMESIVDTLSEVSIMTKYGGGTSGYFGDLRGTGSPIAGNGASNGPVSFMKMFDTAMRVVSQGSRRGSFAAYLPIEHPDIEEFLKIKTKNHNIQDLSFGITITDEFMQSMINGDKEKRRIWAKILNRRKEIGYPYIVFHDTVNRMKPQVFKDHNMMINAQNLCCEISLPSNYEESFVCCIAALAAEKRDEWKNTGIVDVGIRLLDATISEFIAKASNIKHMERAVNFAKRHRSVGLGFTGWHSYLQSRQIPFDSFQAKTLTHEIFKDIQKQAQESSEALSREKGVPLYHDKNRRRNTALMAIAPNTTSSSINGQCSQGIEPFNSNYFTAWLAARSFTRRNKYLERELEYRNMNNETIWSSILDKKGSIQHIKELKEIHDVFKTFGEINQYELLNQAGERQKFIDQGQSLNIHIPAGTSVKKINKIHIHAWESGVKSLYYQRSNSPSAGFSLEDVCVSCSG